MVSCDYLSEWMTYCLDWYKFFPLMRFEKKSCQVIFQKNAIEQLYIAHSDQYEQALQFICLFIVAVASRKLECFSLKATSYLLSKWWFCPSVQQAILDFWETLVFALSSFLSSIAKSFFEVPSLRCLNSLWVLFASRLPHRCSQLFSRDVPHPDIKD